MTEAEDLIRSTTMAIAGTVREVPPLRLAPGLAPAEDGRARPGRRHWGWLAPVTAAAVVLAVAVSLVIVRDISNGPVVPPAGSGSASPVPPRYYVAISGSETGMYAYFELAAKQRFPRNDLVIGDTFSGKKLATFAAPANTVWTGVTAAADDRIFVAFAEPTTGPGLAGKWFMIRLAPGAASPAKLSPLPVEPLSYVAAMALSGSGKELAIVTATSMRAEKKLCVYSVTTGDLLRPCWSTDDQTAIFMGLYAPGQLASELTWIDGDRAIAFQTLGSIQLPLSKQTVFGQTVRSLSLQSDGTNLMADSQVIWSLAPTSPDATIPCGGDFVTVSADGKTVSCLDVTASTNANPQGRWRLAWLTYPTNAADDRGGAPVVDYQLTIPPPTAIAW
jgi:hypothetical protein